MVGPITLMAPVRHLAYANVLQGFPGGSDGKESACNAGDVGLILELRKSLGGGNGYPLHYSFLENSMDCLFAYF